MDYLASSAIELDHKDKSLLEVINSGIQISIQLKNLKFGASDVYHKELKTNVKDESVRSSRTHKIYYKTNPGIFKSVDKLINFINDKQGTLFSLVPDDIDIIKYGPNDFFHRHSDFVPVVNKYISYHTLLYCIDADAVGGETCVYINDQETKFKETITPTKWLLLKNEIDHASATIKSGYKIILKANVIHVNLSDQMFNMEFDKLLTARNEIIKEFLSKEGNVLPVYNLSDYLFYRSCFKNNSTIIPFQFIAMGNGIDEIDIFNTNLEKNKLNKIEPSDNDIIWFNIGNDLPIIYYSSKKDSTDENNKKPIVDKPNEDYDTDSSSETENELETVDNIIQTYLTNSHDLNEIERAMSLMICYFWLSALKGIDDSENYLDIPTNGEAINKLICEKIKNNLDKIQEAELKMFALDKLKNPENILLVKNKFTNDYIYEIGTKFRTETLTYKVSGSYYCNETNYIEYRADVYFGFVRV